MFAAASLKSTFTELATDFEPSTPDEGHLQLRRVLGPGDPNHPGRPGRRLRLGRHEEHGQARRRELVAAPRSTSQRTPGDRRSPANPAAIASFADLAKPGVKVVICAPQVPCGAATSVEEASGTTLKPVSEEASVTDVLGKVTSGEADAGLVYVTDVKGAGDKVKGITFPESAKAVNTYPIATVKTSKNRNSPRPSSRR